MTTTIPDDSPRISMSFREKTAWACLLTTVAIWGPYFFNVIQLIRRHELNAGAILGLFIGAVVLQVVIQIVAAIFIALRSKEEPKDERDLIIEAKASKNAYFVLGFFTMFAVCWIFMYALAAGTVAAGQWTTPLIISQMIFFCFVMAETTRFASQIVSYRRGS